MKFSVKLDVKPLKSIQKNLEVIRSSSVEVGFFPEDQYGPENENLPVAAVAQMQQLGADKYPARPFFYDTVEDRATIAGIAYRMRQLVIESVFSGGVRVLSKSLKGVGEYFAEELRFAIDNYPGRNSDSWAEQKGFNDPLRHTDRMLKSVKVKVKNK